jgi:hypothetical protein
MQAKIRPRSQAFGSVIAPLRSCAQQAVLGEKRLFTIAIGALFRQAMLRYYFF